MNDLINKLISSIISH